MKRLKVYFNNELAGILSKQKGYTFEYEESYFLDSSKPAISLSLSKQQQKHQSETLFPFFFHLLAEGVNKALQSRMLKIDEEDYFSLLAETAQYDTIGAVTVKPDNHE